jgi:CRP-like cAMP-binding protein
LYKDGEEIINQGETGDCMYVIQSGKVMIVQYENGKGIPLAELKEGDFFGDMALIEHKVRSATVRAIGEARVLTVDKRTFLLRVQEDPSIAFSIIQKMSLRIRKLDDELVRIKSGHLN